MGIPENRMARGMDLRRSMLMGIDECHIALREAYCDLTDEEFWRFPFEDHCNIVTLVMHIIQQHDDFNGILQRRRGIKLEHAWRFLEHEERFILWELPKEKLPKPGDKFPTVAETLKTHELLHKQIIENVSHFSEEDFISEGVGRWPRLCDPFFRGIYHANAHIRQIWFLRGIMKLEKGWPVQHYA